MITTTNPAPAHPPVTHGVAASTPGIGPAIDRFDARIDQVLDALRGNAAADRVFYSASALGDWSLLWHLAGVAQGLADQRDRMATHDPAQCRALGVESALVNGVVKSFFRRERPVHVGDRPLNLRLPLTSSFPSGHASSAFMAAHLLAERSRIGPAWYALAAVVATSRVHVRIHHASDVLGGAILGLALGAVVRRLAPIDPD
jgi:undecaprenyl-diphosphatase